jgi:hypothetical protein
MLKNPRTHPWRPSPNNPWARTHRWDQLWSLPGDLNGKFENLTGTLAQPQLAPLSRQRARLQVPESQSLWLTTKWLSFLSSLLAGLGPLWFFVVFQIQNETERTTFETVSGIQRESQAVLDSIKENYFHGDFEALKKTMGSLYTFQMRLFWRRGQPKLNKLSQNFFFDVVRELSVTNVWIKSDAHFSEKLVIAY